MEGDRTRGEDGSERGIERLPGDPAAKSDDATLEFGDCASVGAPSDANRKEAAVGRLPGLDALPVYRPQARAEIARSNQQPFTGRIEAEEGSETPSGAVLRLSDRPDRSTRNPRPGGRGVQGVSVNRLIVQS